MASAKKTTAKRKAPRKPKELKIQVPDHLSVSQILTARCMHRYLLTRLTTEVGTESPAMRAGSFVHSVVYQMTKHCIDAQTDPDPDLVNALIDEEFERYQVEDTEYAALRMALLEFAERGFSLESVLDVEQRFRQDVGEGVIVEGIIDRVNAYRTPKGSVLEIVDYKNQTNIVAANEVQDNLQLNLYRWIATTYLYPGYDLVRTGIYHVRWNFIRWSGEPRPRLDHAKEDESVERLVRRQWERRAKAVAEKSFNCVRGPQCHEWGGCPVLLAGRCPAWSKTEIRKMVTSDNVQDMVRAARMLEAELNDAKKRIRTEMKQQAEIIVDDKRVGYRMSATVKYRLLGIIDWARENNVPLAGIMLSKTDVEGAIKKRLKAVKELGPFDEAGAELLIESSASSRFYLS